MLKPTLADCFQVLVLQLAADGRCETFCGDSIQRIRSVCPPFLVSETFPSVYFEFPLAGDPFCDVTMLYGDMPADAHIDAPAAAGTDQLLRWFGEVAQSHSEISFGFELDTSNPQLPNVAVHFQPRAATELVKPFCEAAGEPERADLYLDLAARMPEGWALSFFGMFRGRPGSPLRVCGYLGAAERDTCIADPNHLASVFDTVGFTAYDDAMLADVSRVMAVAPGTLDFQFDVYPDGHLGNVFAVDVQFARAQPMTIQKSFEDGPAARVMKLLEGMGAVDDRWHLAADAAFARALPFEREDGSFGTITFTLLPQWMKVRWIDGVLQHSKLYYLGCSGELERTEEQE